MRAGEVWEEKCDSQSEDFSSSEHSFINLSPKYIKYNQYKIAGAHPLVTDVSDHKIFI